MNGIEVHGIHRSFKDLRAVQGLDLTVKSGEVYGLVGPDGAGKTTTMRMLLGAIIPDAGTIHLEGVDVIKEPERSREKVGYMPQAYGLYGDLTVGENLRFFGDLHGVPISELSGRIRELLQFVRLDRFRDRRADALSGGMYKKLAIACSIIHSPRILILDEPTNGVDPVSRRELWGLLFRLASDGVAVLVSTPYMDEAERCSRAGLIFQGRILKEGSPDELSAELKGRMLVTESIIPERAKSIIDQFRGDPVYLTSYHSGTGIRVLMKSGKDKGSLNERKRFRSELLKKLRREERGSRIVAGEPGIEDVFMALQAEENP